MSNFAGMDGLVIGLLIPLVGTVLGAGFVFFMRDTMPAWLQKVLLGFASGVMVAASVWSLLIPSMELSEDMGRMSVIPATVGFLLGMAFLLFIDYITPHLHPGNGKPEGPKAHLSRTAMLTLAVTIHNLPEGMAVGVVLAGALQSGTGITAAAALVLSLGIAIQNVPEVDYSAPVDMTNRFTYCWNAAETVTSDGGILVYNGVQWGGVACWLGEADWSEYAKIVFEFAEPTPIATQIFIQGNEDIQVWVNAGAEKAECLFAGHDVSKVSQVALQAAAAGTVKISKIYLLRQTPTGIRPTEIANGEASRQWFLLNGQPAPQGFKGVTVSKGKKVMKK